MTKTIPEIDDEMVDRAEAAFVRNFRDREIAFTTSDVRGLLEAALTEPEIEVTEAMKAAGKNAYDDWVDEDDMTVVQMMINAYRAMVKAAPNGAKSAPQGVNAGAPEKATADRLFPHKDLEAYYTHRRSNDRGWDTPFGMGVHRHAHRRSTDPK
jgi:hypothetical protein